MRPSKLDAALLGALADGSSRSEAGTERDLSVFIATTGSPGPEAESLLRELGVAYSGEVRELFTARLPGEAVRTLSDQPWVKYIKLASPLRPRDEV